MYESDKVVGEPYFAAVLYITKRDLWDEVVNLVVDCDGFVVKVQH